MGSKDTALPKKKLGFMAKLGLLFCIVGLSALLWSLYTISKPQDLSDIAGRGTETLGKKSRNLKEVLKNAEQGPYKVSITEEEINLYLRDTLKIAQAGSLSEKVKIEEVLVRLEEGRAEIIIVRDLFGRPFTTSMYLSVEQEMQANGTISTRIFRNGGLYSESLKRPAIGGRYGELPIPEGFLIFVMPSFEKIASLYTAEGEVTTDNALEMDLIGGMTKISIEEGKIVLDPAPNTAMSGGI